MRYKNIMVAYDGSEPSKEAILVAKDLIGDDADATLHVITVVAVGSLGIDSMTFEGASGIQQIFPDMSSYEAALKGAEELWSQNIEEAVAELLPDANFTIKKDAIVSVKAAEGICEYAKDKNIEMIVMGRRGLGAFRAMLGSVSYSVIHQMDIPVVTVK